LRAPPEVRFERIQRTLEQIIQDSEGGSLIIVEGQRDLDSLRSLGVAGRILCVQSSRRNTFEFAEGIDGRHSVIVLMDFDRQGVFLAKRLSRLLNAQGVRANLKTWRDLKQLTRSEIRSIEELPNLLHRVGLERSMATPVRHAYEVPLLTRQHRISDDKRIRLERLHKARKKGLPHA